MRFYYSMLPAISLLRNWYLFVLLRISNSKQFCKQIRAISTIKYIRSVKAVLRFFTYCFRCPVNSSVYEGKEGCRIDEDFWREFSSFLKEIFSDRLLPRSCISTNVWIFHTRARAAWNDRRSNIGWYRFINTSYLIDNSGRFALFMASL